MQEITSLQNPRIVALRGLKQKKHRKETGSFLVEGEKMVAEALCQAQVLALAFDKDAPRERFAALLQLPQAQGLERCYAVPPHIIEALTESKTPQGVVAQVRMLETAPLPDGLILALDALQDPGNVGAMLRTADAAGWQGVLLGRGCADIYGAKCVQATMGSIFRVPFLQDVDLPQVLHARKKTGCPVAVGVLDGEDIYKTKLPQESGMLVIGNESAGVSPEIIALATHRLRLPMRGGAESLNAAVAAGIFMYEWMREGRA